MSMINEARVTRDDVEKFPTAMTIRGATIMMNRLLSEKGIVIDEDECPVGSIKSRRDPATGDYIFTQELPDEH